MTDMVGLDKASAIERKELRETLSERQNHRCCWCGCRMVGQYPSWNAPTFEHVIPRSAGGSDEPENLVAACRSCNLLRDSMEALPFLAWSIVAREAEAGLRMGVIDWSVESEIVRIEKSIAKNELAHAIYHFERACAYWRNEMRRQTPLRAAWLRCWNRLRREFEPHRIILQAKKIKPATTASLDRQAAYLSEVNAVRDVVIERQNHRCCLCGARMSWENMGTRIRIDDGELKDWTRNPDAFVIPCKTCRDAKRSMDIDLYVESVVRNSASEAARQRELFVDFKEWSSMNLKEDELAAVVATFQNERKAGSPTTWLDFVHTFMEAYEEEISRRANAARRDAKQKAEAPDQKTILRRQSISIVATAGTQSSRVLISIDTKKDRQAQGQAA